MAGPSPQSERSLEQIVLVSGEVGAAELSKFLRLQRPGLTVTPVTILADLVVLPRQLLSRARLIAFASDIVVPKACLDALGFGAYNFHPGPPSHPGWAPACFAIYDRAAIFGATAHLMTERVDDGPIVGTRLFPLPPDITVVEPLRQ